MSVKLMTAIWANGPSNSTERFVLLTLADYANDDGAGAYPSLATIASRCALSRRTVIRAIESLVDSGYLIRRRRKIEGRFTSSEYKINPQKLRPNSDTVSPVVVTNDHYGSDTVSPEWCQDDTMVVTHDLQGGDTVSPNPLPDPSIDPTRGGERPKSRRMPVSSPSSRIQFQDFPESSAERIQHAAMVSAISEVTGMDAKLNFDKLAPAALDLVKAGYEPDQVRSYYARGAPPGRRNWYSDDWRGRKGDLPTVKNISETIGGTVMTAEPPEVEGGVLWLDHVQKFN